MKRFALRLGALTAVVVLGLIAIAQAQRIFPQPEAPAAGANTATQPIIVRGAAPDGSQPFAVEPRRLEMTGGKPLPSAEASDQPPADPFAGGAVRLAGGASDGPSAASSRAARPDSFYLGDTTAARPSRFSGPAAAAQPPADIASDAAAPRRLLEKSSDPAADVGRIRPLPSAGRGASEADRPAALNIDGAAARPLTDAATASPPDGDAPARSGRPKTVSVLRHHPAEHAGADAEPTDNTTRGGGLNLPGPRQLEGAQSPKLVIEKIAPAESQVGKPARFEIKVTNSGDVVAQGVEIHDTVPLGATLVATNPPITAGPTGELTWALGTLKPGEHTSVQVDLAPTTEGEMGSVASVSFRADASAKTIVTRPQLAVDLSAPKQVLVGENVKLSIRVSNPGTGAANGVVITERVPDGLQHPAGSEVEYEVGSLKPGETRQIELVLKAAKAGRVANALHARGEGNLKAQQQVEFDVVAPALAVAMTGPARRYLERQATYTVSVSNPGTAPAKDIELVTQLPRGMKFVKANNSGHYDPQTNTVSWNLEELPAAETGSVTLVAVPIEAGEQKVKVLGKAQRGLSDEKEQTVVVEGLAALEFDVRGADEAIEMGGETTYTIHVVNHGSKAATNVRVSMELPAELKALDADGPSRGLTQEHQAQFEPLARLAPKAEATFHVRAQALQAGDLRVRAQVLTDDMRQPVTKEESTRVYTDQ